MKIASIGLGNMGAGIARNIALARFALGVWNRTPATPVIKAFVDSVITVGTEPGRAELLNLCLNCAVVSSTQLVSAIYAWGNKAGLNLDQMEGFLETTFGSSVFHMYAERVRSRNFSDGGFRMAEGLKDVRLILYSAEQLERTFDVGRIIGK